MLVHNGHIFSRVGKRLPKRDRLKWNCSCKHCPAELNTTKNFVFLSQTGAHLHLPNAIQIEILRAHHFIKLKAIENFLRTPREIYKETIDNFPNAIGKIGTLHNVAQMIYNTRARLLQVPPVRFLIFKTLFNI